MTDSRLKILLVEDNDGDAGLVEEYLDEAGAGQFTMQRAKTLAQGVALLASWGPQVVLLDLNLPDSKGLGTLGSFCAMDGHRPPIVVLTSLDDQDMAEAAIKECAQEYLVKNDVNSRALIRAIRFAVQRHGRTELDRMLDEPDKSDGNSAEAMRVITRINRLSQAGHDRTPPSGQRPAGPPGAAERDAILFDQIATASKASEVVLTGLDQRLGRIEEAQHVGEIADARGETLMKQLNQLVMGNGKGPLSTRLTLLEEAVRMLVDARQAERQDRRGFLSQIKIGVVLMLVSWIGGGLWFLFNWLSPAAK